MKALYRHPQIKSLLLLAALLVPTIGFAAQLQVIATNTLIFPHSPQAVRLLAFSPDSRLLGVAHRGGSAPKMETWTVPDLKLTNGRVHLSGDNYNPTAIAFSADGAFVALSGDYGDAGITRRHRLAMSEELTFDQRRGHLVAISPTTNFVVNGGSLRIEARRFWDVILNILTTDRTEFPSSNTGEIPIAMSFAPDGVTFATTHDSGEVRLWRVGKGMAGQLDTRFLVSYPNPGARFTAINYLADGTEILTGVSNVVWLRPDLQLPTDVRLHRYQGLHVPHVFTVGRGIHATALTPDGKYLFTVAEGDHLVPSNNDKTNIITMWRVADGRAVFTLDRETPGTYTLAVAPNGRYLAYGRWDGLVTLAYLPLVVEEFTLSQGRVTLRWYGGSGRYQVQRRKDPDKGKWHNVGKPTTATTFSEKVPGKDNFQFYRVQSLPNP